MRYLVAALFSLVVLSTLAGIKALQLRALSVFGEEAKAAGPPPEAVGATVSEERTWETTLDSVGTVESSRGVVLSVETAGIVSKIRFDSGDMVPAGAVLVELDTKVERADLASAVTARDLAELEAGRARELAASGAIAPAVRDQAEAQLRDAAARVAGRKAAIERRKIRAPFTGRVGIREIDLGQYLNPGDRVTVLETTDSVFVDFTLPQEKIASLSVGMTVRAGVRRGEEKGGEGQVVAIVPAVDPGTRNVTVRARIPNLHDQLRTGMFVDVSVVLPEKEAVIVVPATAIVHASYGNSVFVLEEKPADDPGVREIDGRPVSVARQRFVKLGQRRGDFVAVASGLEAGRTVVVAGAFKLRNGVPVVVREAGQPAPSLDPRLPNR